MKEYLTEESLGIFVREWMDHDSDVVHNRKDASLGFRPDYNIVNEKTIVEFDGFRHFTDSLVIEQDCIKEAVAAENGYQVLRIPYFIQLDKNGIDFFLGLTSNFGGIIDLRPDKVGLSFNEYPHGFIDSRAALPGDFCFLGLLRYQNIKRRILRTDKGHKIIGAINSGLIRRVVDGTAKFNSCFPDYFFRDEASAEIHQTVRDLGMSLTVFHEYAKEARETLESSIIGMVP